MALVTTLLSGFRTEKTSSIYAAALFKSADRASKSALLPIVQLPLQPSDGKCKESDWFFRA